MDIGLYFLKSSALLTAFWLGYQLLLKRDTFFCSNRWYLLGGIVASAVLPLVTITRTVLVKRHTPMGFTPVDAVSQPEFDWSVVWLLIYAAGFTVFTALFLRNLMVLRRLLKGGTIHHGLRYVDTRQDVAPFSFFNAIVYNSSRYSPQELSGILAHEAAHCRQRHSIDVILMHLYCMLFWFNPIVWLYKKSMLQNLEFLADREALQSLTDARTYQLTLLRVASQGAALPVTNPFHQSLIKKRIVMLNKSQSNQLNSLKYFFIVPLLLIFLLVFQVKVVAQEIPQEDRQVVVSKTTSDAQLKAEAEKLQKHGVKLKFSKVKRNASGEITGLKADFKADGGQKGSTQISGDKPINPMSLMVNPDGTIAWGKATKTVVIKNHDIEVPGFPLSPEMALIKVPQIDLDTFDGQIEENSTVIIKKNGEKAQVFINGKQVDAGEDVKLKGKSFSFSSGDEGNFVIVNGEDIAANAREKAREVMEISKLRLEESKKLLEESAAKRAEARKARTEIREFQQRDAQAVKTELEKARAELEKAREALEQERRALQDARDKK